MIFWRKAKGLFHFLSCYTTSTPLTTHEHIYIPKRKKLFHWISIAFFCLHFYCCLLLCWKDEETVDIRWKISSFTCGFCYAVLWLDSPSAMKDLAHHVSTEKCIHAFSWACQFFQLLKKQDTRGELFSSDSMWKFLHEVPHLLFWCF